MFGVGKKAAKMVRRALMFLWSGQHVLHPMECLDHPHGWATCPEEAARRRRLEVNFLGAKFNWLKPRIYQHFDSSRYGRSQTKIVGGGHAIDNKAGLVAAGDSADHRAIVRYGITPC